MKKVHIHFLLLIVAFSMFFIYKISFGQASTIVNQQVESQNEVNINEEITSQGKIVFSYKPDYESLSKFLGLNKDDYFNLRKDYSMLEIAHKQNISEEDLFNYLVNNRFEALEAFYKEEKIDLPFIMNYTLHLKEDVKWEMKIKSLKK